MHLRAKSRVAGAVGCDMRHDFVVKKAYLLSTKATRGIDNGTSTPIVGHWDHAVRAVGDMVTAENTTTLNHTHC